MKNETKNITALEDRIDEIVAAVKNAISESYGVKGISKIQNTKGQKEEGIKIQFKSETTFIVDLHLIVAGDVKITETLRSCQKTVRFYMDHLFPKSCIQVNLFAEEIF